MPSFARPRDVILHCEVANHGVGRVPVVFLNSLGTDYRIWREVVAGLGKTECLLWDKRGHGLSDCAATSIDTLAEDVADLMDMLGWRLAILCGVSVGGLIAQRIAHRRPDLVGGLILSNTGTKIGDDEVWNTRIQAVRESGIDAIADTVMERWFSNRFRAEHPDAVAGYRNMLTRIPAEGYVATCEAIRDADLAETTSQIRVPTICIGGREDQATPPELVEALADLIKGAERHILPDVGHLPCVEAPGFVAGQIRALLGRVA